MEKKVFVNDQGRQYMQDPDGSVQWVDNLQRQGSFVFVDIQISGKVYALSCLKLKAPIQGMSVFWDMRTLQDC
eukprot:7180069-Lingulodinium_polyedra.AAC.1